MKKIVCLVAVAGITFFMAAQSYADISLANGGGGNPINETGLDATIGVNTFNFTPSGQVVLFGDSGPNYFVAAAYHAQAAGTGGGKEYGMAYDSTQVFWYDVSDDANIQAVTGSDSTVFGAGWGTQ